MRKALSPGTDMGQGYPDDECILSLVGQTGVYGAVGVSEDIDVHVRTWIRSKQGYPKPDHGWSG